MFYGAATFNQDISSWDTATAINMEGMFYQAAAFNHDISDWDVDKVTNMIQMLKQASVFNQELCSWGQYYKSTISYGQMFQNSACTNMTNPLDADGPWCSGTSQAQCPALLVSSPIMSIFSLPIKSWNFFSHHPFCSSVSCSLGNSFPVSVCKLLCQ